MDLRNNKITLGEILLNSRGKSILGRNFPELMNPFLLEKAWKMNLDSTFKLAQGTNARAQINKMILDLEAV